MPDVYTIHQVLTYRNLTHNISHQILTYLNLTHNVRQVLRRAALLQSGPRGLLRVLVQLLLDHFIVFLLLVSE